MHADEVALEWQRSIRGHHHRLNAIVRHRQNVRSDTKTARHRSCEFRQRGSATQRLRSLDMHGEIAITQPEPGFATEIAKRRHEVPGFISTTPAALDIAEATQRVDDRVDIRRNMQTEVLEVVACIDDNGQVRTDQAIEAKRQLGAADAATQRDDRFAS